MDLLKNTLLGALVDQLTETRLEKDEPVKVEPQLAFIDASSSLQEALQTLKERQLRSMPVFDSANNKFIGLLDSYTIMKAVAYGDFVQSDEEMSGVLVCNFDKHSVRELALTQPIDVLDHKLSVHDALHSVARNGRALVRVAKMGAPNEHSYKMVSAIDIGRFLLGNAAKVGEDDDKKLKSNLTAVGLVNPTSPDDSMVVLKSDYNALKSYYLLSHGKQEAGPVVDSQSGELVAVLSSSSARNLTTANVNNVLDPILQFLSSSDTVFHPITVTPRKTLADCLLALVAAKIHQVVVVNSAQKPLAMIGYREIFRVLAGEDGATAKKPRIN